IRFPGPLQPSQPSVPPHQHHIQHIGRKIPIDGFPLRDVTDDGPLLFIPLSVNADLSGRKGQKSQNRLDQRRFPGAVRTDDPDQFPLRRFKGNIPENRLAVVGDGQIPHRYGNRPFLHVSPPPRFPHFSADTMVSTLCRIMPTYVPSGVPASPRASEYSSPPMLTRCPFAAAPLTTASMERFGTLDSINTALIFRSVNRFTSCWTSLSPYSDAVLMPCRPTTWIS